MNFWLYVTAVEGRLVTRFGARGRSYIGATRDGADPTKITWDTASIVPIPEDEYARFRREYERECAAGGGLRKRTKAEYEEQRENRLAAKKLAAEKEAARLTETPQPAESHPHRSEDAPTDRHSDSASAAPHVFEPMGRV